MSLEALAEEIAAIVKELESLDLTKAARDRRLELNALLQAKRATLEKGRRSAELSAELEAIAAKLRATEAKAERRELQRQRSRVEAELRELG